MLNAEQFFARKVLYIPFVEPRVVANEARAVSKLCRDGAHPNIVAVFRHGQLPNMPCYFIDMELCDINLTHYMYSGMVPDNIPAFSRDDVQQIWNVMISIASGVKYIHNLGEVHRDLRPDNSMFLHYLF